MRYNSLKSDIFEKLNTGLRKEYLYHSVEHTEMVLSAVEEITSLEQLSAEDIMIIRTAALLHDLGLINVYYGHEEESVRLSREFLPAFDYSPDQAEQIFRLIMATKMPQKPEEPDEMILCDADMFYLGEESYLERSGYLREELSFIGKHYSDEEWCTFQVKFLEEHRFHTASACNLRRDGKEANLNIMKQRCNSLTTKN